MMLRFAPILLLFACLVAAPASAATIEAQNYRHAFALIDSNRALEAEIFAVHGHDPVLNKVIRAIYMAQPGNDTSFETMADFIAHNPDWPDLKGIEAIAEQKIPTTMPAAQVLGWFATYPPVSLVGFYRLIDTLNITGQTENVAALIRKRWIEGEFTVEELSAFRGRFQQFLGEEEDRARLDRLLWKGETANARHMYPLIDGGLKALAEARIGLASRSGNVDALIERVPRSLLDDPGLEYERLRWHVHNNRDDEAISILKHAPDSSGKPELWWEQRQIMARRLMANKDYDEAYELASNHGPLEGRPLVDAEFLSGWLAFRFLNSLEDARRHFQTIYDHSATPLSHARGAYWLGRVYEAHGDKNQAQQIYETAAGFNMTYYGQLAAAHIYENPVIQATPEPAIPPAVRNAFFNQDLIQAVEKLSALGEHDRAHTFFHSAVDSAHLRADFTLLMELGYRIERPDYAIEAGKAANLKNIMITAGGFPLLGRTIPHPPDPAFTHALIRQESMFNPEARSPVGAEGLMQLMPSTAKGVAKKLGVRYRPKMLSDPTYNLHLGTAFVEDQISSFDGSYILALAGYNAGPHRVREWMTQIGDPRQDDVDVIDWVEQIPISETRNYVQRIMESLQIYRARLAGGHAPLQIMKDLKRGAVH